MKKLAVALSLAWLASMISGCKKNMPPVVASRWSAIEELARAAGPICDRVLALPECPLEADGLPHPEAGPEVKLPGTPLVGATEIREVEVYCTAKKQSKDDFTHSCYLQHYFDPQGRQLDAGWDCGGTKPYPGWEHGLYFSDGRNCKERLYRAAVLRTSPAGNTVQATVYFYIDGHAPAVSPAPAPQ
jgi:hypothetical protein